MLLSIVAIGCGRLGYDAQAAPDASPADTFPPTDTGDPDTTPTDPLLGYSSEFDGTPLHPDWRERGAPSHAMAEMIDGALVMIPSGPEEWRNSSRAALLFVLVEGDFAVETRVSVESMSMPGEPAVPSWRLAGLLARDPAGDTGMENHVLTVIGAAGSPLQTEFKNTVMSSTTVEGEAFGDMLGTLRLCRVGGEVRVLTQPSDGSATHERTYTRTDLPPELQVGIFVESWTNNPVDVIARFEYVRFWRPTSLASCSFGGSA